MNNDNLYKFLSIAIIWGSMAYSKPIVWWLAIIGGLCTIFIILSSITTVNRSK